MCHEHFDRERAWMRDRERDRTEAAEETDDELPSHLNEEGPEEAELLTDGGDES